MTNTWTYKNLLQLIHINATVWYIFIGIFLVFFTTHGTLVAYTEIGGDEELPLGEEFQEHLKRFIKPNEKKVAKRIEVCRKLVDQLGCVEMCSIPSDWPNSIILWLGFPLSGYIVILEFKCQYPNNISSPVFQHIFLNVSQAKFDRGSPYRAGGAGHPMSTAAQGCHTQWGEKTTWGLGGASKWT